MNTRNLFKILIISAVVTGCARVNIAEFLHASNLDSSKWPWNGVAQGKIKKWHGLIPVKTNGVVRAEDALDRVEAELGKTLFDRDSISEKLDSEIERGIIVSIGTAVAQNMDENTCGNVGAKPSDYSYPPGFLKSSGEIDTTLYVNLGSQYCDDTKKGDQQSDIAVHEFGHALGLGEHFQGFGIGPIISPQFWAVLKEIYK